MKPGVLVIVNGASSAGKSSLVREFQQLVDKPFLDIGLDKFIFSLPKHYLSSNWTEILGEGDRAGPAGDLLASGMHSAWAALCMSGNNVIADHVLVEESWVRECANLFVGFETFLVGLRCPIAVLEARERDRADRTLGQAKKQYLRVHANLTYDLELDSAQLSAAQCAVKVWDCVSNHEPKALAVLRQRYT